MKIEDREYFESHFMAIRAEMKADREIFHIKLSAIEKQTTQTNGRVTRVEEKVQVLQLSDQEHVLRCPQDERLRHIEHDLQDWQIIKKYPKLILFIAIGGITSVVISVLFKFHIL